VESFDLERIGRGMRECGRVERPGNALRSQGVAVATLQIQNVMRRSSAKRNSHGG
jgi:hypothetical protein